MRSSWPLAALLLLFLALRLAFLHADPPLRYPNNRFTQELFVEGPAKASEARRFGIFGGERRSADTYRIWGVQSPAYVKPLGIFFRVFGPGYGTLRVFGALAGALGLLALWALGRRHPDPLVAPLACLITAVSFHDIVLTRGGLLEPYLDAVLAATFLTAVLALRRLPWLLAAEVGFAAALLTKQTALLVFPALLALGVWAQVAAWRRGAPRWQHLVTVGAGLGLALGLLAYVRTDAYWATVEWNFGHMVVGVEGHRDVALGALKPARIVDRLVDWRRWQDAFLLIVPLGVLAILQIARVTMNAARGRGAEPVDVAAAAWLVCALLGLQLTEHIRPRFSIVVLPPAALLAAGFLGWFVSTIRARLLRWSLPALAMLVLLGTDLRWTWRWWSTAGEQMYRAGRTLSRELDEDAVLIGAWATPLAFDTRADIYYVKGPFNTAPGALADLGVTHLLVQENDPAARLLARAHPEAFASRRPLEQVKVLGRTYTLFRLERPLE